LDKDIFFKDGTYSINYGGRIVNFYIIYNTSRKLRNVDVFFKDKRKAKEKKKKKREYIYDSLGFKMMMKSRTMN